MRSFIDKWLLGYFHDSKLVNRWNEMNRTKEVDGKAIECRSIVTVKLIVRGSRLLLFRHSNGRVHE